MSGKTAAESRAFPADKASSIMLDGLRDYLCENSPERANAALMLAASVLSAVREHSVKIDPLDFAEFQEGLRRIETKLSLQPEPEQLRYLAGAASASIAEYHSRASRKAKEQSSHLAAMVKLLTTAIADLGAASETSVGCLKQIEQRLDSTLRLTDLNALRQHLEFCIGTLREEASRQREFAAKTVTMMRGQLEALPGGADTDETPRCPLPASQPETGSEPDEAPEPGREGLDAVTGLPARAAAEQALAAAVRDKAKVFVCLYSCQRIALINKRYGRPTGDRLLETALRRIEESVPADCQLFKWSGRSFLGLLERDGDLAAVRSETQHQSSTRIDTSIDIGHRTVMLPLLITAQIFPVFAYRQAPALFRDIDQYLYEQDKNYSRPPDASSSSEHVSLVR